MSEHTKEPWRLGTYPDNEMHGKESVLVDLPGNRKYVLLTCNTNFLEDARANARRIVACVNVCAGIPTEELEQFDGGIGKGGLALEHAFAEARMIAQQRDELLAAATKTIEENGHLADGDCCTLKVLRDAVEKINDAGMDELSSESQKMGLYE